MAGTRSMYSRRHITSPSSSTAIFGGYYIYLLFTLGMGRFWVDGGERSPPALPGVGVEMLAESSYCELFPADDITMVFYRVSSTGHQGVITSQAITVVRKSAGGSP